MENRYAGDVGDFGKIGLLRQIASAGFDIGVNWYLAPDETHNNDGIEGKVIARNKEERDFVEGFLANSKADQYDILDTLQYDLTVEMVETLYPEGFADELLKSLNK